MIERKFIQDNLNEFRITEFVKASLGRVGLSTVKLQKTPLGEKIVISASRPGLVVGRAGSNISRLTRQLKEEFKLENPQIEIEEVQNVGLDANIIAELIASSLERFGTNRFKGVGHKYLSEVMNAGAQGVEIIIKGKIPGARAKSWRFAKGYLKKAGDVALTGVNRAYATAKLKAGTVGVKVSIMPPGTILPDRIHVNVEAVIAELEEPVQKVAALVAEDSGSTEAPEVAVKEKPEKKEAKKSAKKAAKKSTKKSVKNEDATEGS
ncbi:MAG: 30S ribosomal protein S3 [Candidatus Woesearchaeota archaeon]